jgi:hypothetical protein
VQWVFLGCPGVTRGHMLVGFPSSCKCHTSLWAIWSDRSFPNLHLWQNRCVVNVPDFFLCVSPPTHPPTDPLLLLLFLLTEESLLGSVFIIEMQKHHSSCFPSTIFFSLNGLSACLLAWVGACLFVVCTQNLIFWNCAFFFHRLVLCTTLLLSSLLHVDGVSFLQADCLLDPSNGMWGGQPWLFSDNALSCFLSACSKDGTRLM